MMSSASKSPLPRILTAMIGLSLLAIIAYQQTRIRKLEQNVSKTAPDPGPSAVSSNRTEAAPAESDDRSRRSTRRSDDPLEAARKERAASIEKQLEEISAPLSQDMASTMFKTEVMPGQSIVTGGYKTPEDRSQFTILKPEIINRNGHDSIRIAAKIIDMGAEDIVATGMDSLATNAKNTLQHAETWEESDVSNTMETLKKSGVSDMMSSPEVMVTPGTEFMMSIGTNETGSYVLKGIATISPTGSGVVLETRIEQRDPPASEPPTN